MKRKLLSILLTLCLAFSLLPTAALAEGEGAQTNDVAQIGSTKYASLADAIAAASSGATVTLLADVYTPETSYTIRKSLTIDLNGKTITADGYDSVFAIEGEDNHVVINATNGGKVIAVERSGSAGKYAMAVWLAGKDSTLTINGGEFSQSITSMSDPQMDMIYTSKGVITINGGTFHSGTPKWTLNIKDNAYKDGSANIIVNGGTFVGYDPRNAENEGKGTSLVAEGVGVDADSTNGTFTAKSGMVAQIIGMNGNSKKAFGTLQEAITAAGRKTTVKLLADTKENVTISTSDVTLDLNGHTLNGSTGECKPALTITARVTVMDSSEGHTGTIMREDTAENSGVSSHYVIDVQGSGWLTFESGTVKNDSGAGGTKGASLVRVGDDSVAKYPGLNIKGGTFTQDNFIVIKVYRGDLFLNGGTLKSANSYAVENRHRATIKGGTVNGNVAAWTYSGGPNSDLTISGGTVNGNVEAVSYDGAEGKLAKVAITGGTVNGALGTYIYSNGLTETEDTSKATIKITGGTFSSDPTRYVVEDSAVTKNNEDNTFGVAKAYLASVGNTSYYTMDEAFKAQTTSGEPIDLLRDYTTGSTFNSGTVARVVNLNGHTWTCTGTDANSAAFEINNPNASLTVKNGKIVSSQLVGLIPSASGGTITYDNSILTFENVEMSTTATSGIETNGNNTNDSVTLKNSTLDVPNGFGIYFPSSGKLTIENSTINAKTMGVQVCAGSLNINGGSKITVTGDAVPKGEGDGAIQDGAAISIVKRTGYKELDKIEVTGGTFKANGNNAAIKAYDWNNATKTEETFTESTKVSVSGGYFTSDPTAYLAARHYVWASDKDGYAYMVKGTAPTSADQKIIVIDKTDATVSGDITGPDETAIDNVIGKANVDGVAEAVRTDVKTEIVSASNASHNDGDKVEIEVSVNVSVTEANLTNGSMTFTATPVATVKVNGSAASETVDVTNAMLNGKPITVKLPLPTVNGSLFTPKQIKHISSDNSIEYFILNTAEEANLRGAKTFKIEDGCAVFIITKFSKFELSGTVTYVEPSYSSGSSSDPTYSVSTPSKTEHGTVTVSPKSASKGDTVTVTVKPDSGYVLETLTVTDKNGNELTLKDKGNGKYAFTMPSGKVEVKATFMEDNSMLNFFYDVPNNAYFYEAVKWAVENGITTGVGNDLFAPEQPCTRAQIVTFLWRAAGSPEPKGAASGMTDVVSGSYYEKAVAWAIENGITTGTTTSTFSPDATCTRAQAVTFLARALNAKAASAAEFSDVPADSYFADAVAWAAANGVTEGIGGGLFGSDNDCTRGQIVTFLYRAYNK